MRASRQLSRGTLGAVLGTVLLSAPEVGAQAPSRAEDPTYEPGEAKTTEDGAATSPSVEEDVRRIEGAALSYEVPDLVVKTWPPPLRWIVALGSHYPLQFMGVGLGIEVYPVDFLRVDALWSGGVSVAPNYAGFNQYAHAIVGVRVLDFEGSATKTVMPPPNRKGFEDKRPPLFKTSLPLAHAVLLEAGMLTGSVPLLKSTASSAEPSDGEPTPEVVAPQLFYPLAGVRYVLNSWALSKKQPGINRSLLVQVWAHVLYQPFNDSTELLRWADHTRVERHRFGGTGGFSFPFCGRFCASLSISAGYLPAPAAVMFGFGMGS